MKPFRNANAGFTLIELLTSMAILGVMMFLLFSAFDQTTKAWLQGESRVETYSGARAALDYMTRELAQAVVNTNNLQFFGSSNAMAFIVSSSDNLTDAVDLAEVVYRLNQVSATPSAAYPGDPFTNNAPPYKLMRRTSVYSTTAVDCWDFGKNQPCAAGANAAWDFYYPNTPNWMETSQSNRVAILADNIMSLTFTFVTTNSLQYSYWNSTNVPNIWNNELPNLGIPNPNTSVDINNDPGSFGVQYMANHAPAGVYITIGAIDSRTAARLQVIAPGGVTNASNVGPFTNTLNQAEKFFTTFVEIPNQ